MTIPNISSLTLEDRQSNTVPSIPDDILHATDKYTKKLKCYAATLPYSIESNERGQEILDRILLRLAQCLQAKDYDPGFLQWNTKLTL
jgi:proteasome activator subunit 4